MKIYLSPACALLADTTGPGSVTRKMVRERAVQLAAGTGRSDQEISKSDWEQAKRELGEVPVREAVPTPGAQTPGLGHPAGFRRTPVSGKTDRE